MISNIGASTITKASSTAAATTNAALPVEQVSANQGGEDVPPSSSNTVSISPLAHQLNNLAQFFAGRDNQGPSFALSNGVTNALNVNDPSAAGVQKSFSQVALDARASMDAQYAAMKASGKPFDMNSWEGKDVYTLMDNLDRRSLYAVKSNQGGQFTKDEQTMASIIMGQQEGLAMGLYTGPTSKAGAYASPFNSVSDGLKNGVHFLDSVSSEEKSSLEWAIERAGAQITYENAAENEHKVPEKLDSESPLVKLIMAAMNTMKHHPNSAWTTGSLTTADDLKRQPWFNGFESQLDQVMQQLQDKNASVQ